MALNKTDIVAESPWWESFDPLATHNDPLLPGYWHLGPATGATKGINVLGVWDEFRGNGIIVGLIDDGVDYNHPDLAPHYGLTLDFDARNNDADAFPSDPTDAHGTATAGVVGAALDNGIGGAGVAPEATIVGYRMGFGANGTTSQLNADFARLVNLDVANNSWGYGGFLSDNFTSATFAPAAASLVNALHNGRGGDGTIVVFAAGNGYAQGQDVNYHNFQNYRGVISVAATDSAGNIASFSTPGDAILVAAPGVSIQTTDRVGAAGYSTGDFATLSGTSFSSPIVSGVAALMLDANPNLGWRDVQEILASTAIKTGSATGWSANHADNWNGGTMHVSSDFGFGLVDAMAAVRVAESWHKVSTSWNEMVVAGASTPNAPIADLGSVQSVINLAAGVRIDHVEVDINLLHTYIGDLRITLTSPTGTQSVLFNRPPTSQDNIFFTFSSTHDWGEMSGGAWTLTVNDLDPGDTGTLLNWALRAYGDQAGDDTYVYTGEFGALAATDLSRRFLADSGGVDGINTAAIASATWLDLRPGHNSFIAGQTVTIATGTVIENADTGDGNDTLIGNDANNWLSGWRGNDTLDGGPGIDTAVYAGARGSYTITKNGASYSVSGGNDGADTVTNIEWLQFSDNQMRLGGSLAMDTNGDGKSDFLVRNIDGSTLMWQMNGAQITSNTTMLGAGNWTFINGYGDYNGDGKSDLLVSSTNGTTLMWLMNGTQIASNTTMLGAGGGWSVVDGQGDYDGDGKSDLLVNNTNGTTLMWLMNGTTISSNTTMLGAGGAWTVIDGHGDYNGDGKSDLLIGNSDGTTLMWLMNGTQILSNVTMLGAGGGWSIVDGQGDYNGDGNSDLLVRNSTDGTTLMWLMNGTQITSNVTLLGAGGNWSVVDGHGDYNDDGNSDLLVRNTDGTTLMWLMNGTQLTSNTTLLGAGTWSVADGHSDYNADGKSDLIVANTDGRAQMWLMNGNQIVSNTTLVGVGPWSAWETEQGGAIKGDGNNNTLAGTVSNDTLSGFAGNDNLTGGAGTDTFIFNTALNASTNVDTITDFTAGGDRLMLDHAIFTALTAGNLSAGNFVAQAGVTAHDANDFILYDTTTGNLSYDADGTGATAAIQFANLANHAVITAADLLVV